MEVIFRRTGARQYAVIVAAPGRPPQTMAPAPGFDEHIPHDLVHYVVEAELGLRSGVFGRAAAGGGTFRPASAASTPRELARARRKQARREQSLSRRDDDTDLRDSEQLAYLSDIAWRRSQGQRPAPGLWQSPAPIAAEDSARIARVVARLDGLASLWSQLPVEGELVFEWPALEPRVRDGARSPH